MKAVTFKKKLKAVNEIIFQKIKISEYKFVKWLAKSCIGFVLDGSGTFIMYKLGSSKTTIGFHDILGIVALLFMFYNAVGAIYIF